MPVRQISAVAGVQKNGGEQSKEREFERIFEAAQEREKKKAEQEVSVKKSGFGSLPVILAKTQYYLTDDAKKIGVTKNFDFTITDFEINSGAGYIVAIAGKMLLMPGLGKTPNAVNMTIDNNENISGLF